MKLLIYLLSLFTFVILFSCDVSAQQIKKIAIDAAHGGSDLGNSSNGINEKDFNLKIAKSLANQINSSGSGYGAILTRSEDVEIPIIERAQIVKAFNADMLISINVGDLLQVGISSYVVGPANNGRAQSVSVAENEVILREENASSNYNNYNPGISDPNLLIVKLDEEAMKASIRIAVAINDKLDNVTSLNKNNVGCAEFIISKYTGVPVINVQLGSIYNKKDLRYLNDKWGADKIAEGIFSAIIQINNETKTTGNVLIKETEKANLKINGFDVDATLLAVNSGEIMEYDIPERSSEQKQIDDNLAFKKKMEKNGKMPKHLQSKEYTEFVAKGGGVDSLLLSSTSKDATISDGISEKVIATSNNESTDDLLNGTPKTQNNSDVEEDYTALDIKSNEESGSETKKEAEIDYTAMEIPQKEEVVDYTTIELPSKKAELKNKKQSNVPNIKEKKQEVKNKNGLTETTENINKEENTSATNTGYEAYILEDDDVLTEKNVENDNLELVTSENFNRLVEDNVIVDKTAVIEEMKAPVSRSKSAAIDTTMDVENDITQNITYLNEKEDPNYIEPKPTIEEIVKEKEIVFNVEKKRLASSKGIEFRVQILMRGYTVPPSSEQFKNTTGAIEYTHNGYYKYTIGSNLTYNEAASLKREMREQFYDAFVVAFKDGERIPTKLALNEIKQYPKQIVR